MADLIKSFEDNNVQTGEIYLGGITCTDMPKGLNNAELKVEVIKNSFGAKIYYFTILIQFTIKKCFNKIFFIFIPLIK